MKKQPYRILKNTFKQEKLDWRKVSVVDNYNEAVKTAKKGTELMLKKVIAVPTLSVLLMT